MHVNLYKVRKVTNETMASVIIDHFFIIATTTLLRVHIQYRQSYQNNQKQQSDLLTSLCPDMVFSNLPSYAPQILMSLSAAVKTKQIQSVRDATSFTTVQLLVKIQRFTVNMTDNSHELASHSPLGLNLTEETALVWPASVNFRL